MKKYKFLFKVIFVSIFVLVFLSLLISYHFLSVYIKSLFISEVEFQRIIQKIRNNTDFEAVINILEWEKNEMYNTYNKPLNFFCKFWFFLNPKSIFFTKCGSCGEFTYAFVEIAKSKNLKVREISNLCRDHAWAEVFINNQWIPVETTGGKDGLNASHFYDCNWTVGLAYVFFINNSREVDLTPKYICKEHLAHLILISEPNSEIKILRHNCQPHKIFTNSSGISEIYLGKGNYSIDLEKHLFYSSSLPLEVKGNETIIKKIKVEFNWPRLVIIILLIVSSIFLIYMIKKVKHKFSRKYPEYFNRTKTKFLLNIIH
jgi:hypothetical protein